MVTFIVGPEKEESKVHKHLVYQYSTTLKVAFNSNFLEGQTQTYNLEGVSEGCFKLFLEWMYSKTFEDATTVSECLLELWVLADRSIIPKLQNFAIDLLRRSQLLHLESLEWVWETQIKTALFVDFSSADAPGVFPQNTTQPKPTTFQKKCYSIWSV